MTNNHQKLTLNLVIISLKTLSKNYILKFKPILHNIFIFRSLLAIFLLNPGRHRSTTKVKVQPGLRVDLISSRRLAVFVCGVISK